MCQITSSVGLHFYSLSINQFKHQNIHIRPKHCLVWGKLQASLIYSKDITMGFESPAHQHIIFRHFSLVFIVCGDTKLQWSSACYSYSRCWVRLSLAFFSGRQTGQSCRVQFFQWEMICLDDAQWGTVEKNRFWSPPNSQHDGCVISPEKNVVVIAFSPVMMNKTTDETWNETFPNRFHM